MLTVERLRQVVKYDPETGEFTNLFTRRSATKGERAGSRSRDRWKLQIDGRTYQAHRLAWFYMTGEWPAHEIDHINGIPNDNRWENLRQATSSQNNMNSKRPIGRSGVRGVWRLRSGRWGASIRRSGKLHYLGTFVTAEATGEAFRRAAIVEHGEFYCTR